MRPAARGKSKTRAVYDELAPRYDAGVRPLDRWFLSRLRRKALAALPPGGRILELGVGTGLNFAYYREGAAGVASDLSREMLNIARNRKIAGVHLIQSCAEALPFRNHVFEAAFATLVFCSVESPTQAFAELRRVIKPGGYVVLLEHVRPDGLLGPLFDGLNLITTALFDDHFNRRTAESAQSAGLVVTTRERYLLGIVNLIVCRV